jgi:hypothetical protein
MPHRPQTLAWLGDKASLKSTVFANDAKKYDTISLDADHFYKEQAKGTAHLMCVVLRGRQAE